MMAATCDQPVMAMRYGLELDEDAFAWARDRCIDDLLAFALRNLRQAARTAGIVERFAQLGNVGNAVFQLNEDVGTMVEA